MEILAGANPVAIDERDDLGAIQAALSLIIDLFHARLLFEGGRAEQSLQASIVAMSSFAIDQQRQSLFKRELLGVGLFKLLEESVGHPGELERAQVLQCLLSEHSGISVSLTPEWRNPPGFLVCPRLLSGRSLIVSRAANVLVNVRREGRFRLGLWQWLGIEPAFEDRADARLPEDANGQGAPTGGLQPLV